MKLKSIIHIHIIMFIFFFFLRYATARAMPQADVNNDLLATSVSHSNGLTSFSFIRTLFSNNSRDISLVSPRFFVYGANGTATFSDGRISSVGQHPRTPIVSNEKVTLGTPSQCPGKGLGGERMNSYLSSLCFFLSLSLSFSLCLSLSFCFSLSLPFSLFLSLLGVFSELQEPASPCSGGYTNDCSNGVCAYNATWEVRGRYVKFVVTGRVPRMQWLAIGFSDNRLMVSNAIDGVFIYFIHIIFFIDNEIELSHYFNRKICLFFQCIIPPPSLSVSSFSSIFFLPLLPPGSN